MPIKALLFDFDGVILDSLDVKTRAFYEMYLPYGEEIAQAVKEHHLAHGGISRFEKFRIYHKQHLHKDLTENEVQQLAEEFSEIVLQGVIASPEVNGIRKFLESAKEKYAMWVITGTPTEEIKVIAAKTGFAPYFRELLGSPEKKDYWTKKVLSENHLHPEEVVFIGDATTDYEAAHANKVHFVLREHDENLQYFKEKNLIRIRDFSLFNEVLESLN